MPPQRRPLAPLNNDRIRTNELGIYRRGQIEGLRKIGLPMATISRVLDIPKPSVHTRSNSHPNASMARRFLALEDQE
jgi:DNA-binding transcriptional MerR regulator